MIKSETKVTALAAGPARGRSSRYWLIVKKEYGRMETLTINLAGHEAVPIFSFTDEAEMFIRFEAGDGWRARETWANELVSVLLGPCAGVEWVALDPWPGINVGMVVGGLIGVSRWDFVDMLVGGLEASHSTAREHALGSADCLGHRCLPSRQRWSGSQDSDELAQAEIGESARKTLSRS